MTALARRAASAAVRRWRRSLQLRVAATTLVLSSTVVVLLGLVLLHQVRDGLLDGKTKSAVSQLDSGVQYATAKLQPTAQQPTVIRETAETVVQDLGGGSEQTAYGVALLALDPTDSFAIPFGVANVPRELRQSVAREHREAWAYAPILEPDGHVVPGLIVGAQLPLAAPRYQLYFLFPLTQEQQTLALVQRTMALAGAVIVVLLVGISAVVTR